MKFQVWNFKILSSKIYASEFEILNLKDRNLKLQNLEVWGFYIIKFEMPTSFKFEAGKEDYEPRGLKF